MNLDEESGELSNPMTGSNCSALTNSPPSLPDCEMNLDEESGELSPPMTGSNYSDLLLCRWTRRTTQATWLLHTINLARAYSDVTGLRIGEIITEKN